MCVGHRSTPASAMTDFRRLAMHILQDPWTARVFLAFTVGLLLTCSAEFAAEQAVDRLSDAGVTAIPTSFTDAGRLR